MLHIVVVPVYYRASDYLKNVSSMSQNPRHICRMGGIQAAPPK
jgi:hypothetical protein